MPKLNACTETETLRRAKRTLKAHPELTAMEAALLSLAARGRTTREFRRGFLAAVSAALVTLDRPFGENEDTRAFDALVAALMQAQKGSRTDGY